MPRCSNLVKPRAKGRYPACPVMQFSEELGTGQSPMLFSCENRKTLYLLRKWLFATLRFLDALILRSVDQRELGIVCQATASRNTS